MLVPVIANTIATTTAMIPRYSTAVCPLSLSRIRMPHPSGVVALGTRSVCRNTPGCRGPQGPNPDLAGEPAARLLVPPRRHRRSPQSCRGTRCRAQPLRGGFGAAGAVEFGENAVDVVLDGLLADEAGGGDLLVVQASCDEVHDLRLPHAQSEPRPVQRLSHIRLQLRKPFPESGRGHAARG